MKPYDINMLKKVENSIKKTSYSRFEKLILFKSPSISNTKTIRIQIYYSNYLHNNSHEMCFPFMVFFQLYRTVNIFFHYCSINNILYDFFVHKNKFFITIICKFFLSGVEYTQ